MHHETFGATHVQNSGVRSELVMVTKAAYGFRPKTRMIAVPAVAVKAVPIKVLAPKASRFGAVFVCYEPAPIVYRSLCCRITIEEVEFLFHGR